jgi:hypothetical protein
MSEIDFSDQRFFQERQRVAFWMEMGFVHLWSNQAPPNICMSSLAVRDCKAHQKTLTLLPLSQRLALRPLWGIGHC